MCILVQDQFYRDDVDDVMAKMEVSICASGVVHGVRLVSFTASVSFRVSIHPSVRASPGNFP